MDTPIYDEVSEQVKRGQVRRWPHVDAGPPVDPDLPTVRGLALLDELFRELSEPTHEWGAGPGLFRAAVVASGRWRWAA